MRKTQILMSLLGVAALMLFSCGTPTGDDGNWSGIKMTGTEWLEAFGTAVAVDGSGNVITAGFIVNDTNAVSNAYLDGQLLDGQINFFVVKRSAGGSRIWTRVLGYAGFTMDPASAENYAKATGVAVDSDGNVYVCGYAKWDGIGMTTQGLDGQLCLDNLLNSGIDNAFLTKYSSSGTKQWTRLLGTTGDAYNTRAHAIAVDSNGAIYLTGYTESNLALSPILSTTSFTGAAGSDRNLFIAKFDTYGAIQNGNTVLLGSAGANTVGNSIAVSTNGFYIFLAGTSTDGSISGLTAATTSGSSYFLMCTYDDYYATFHGVEYGPQTTGGVVEGTGIAVSPSTITTDNGPYTVYATGFSSNGVASIGAPKGTGLLQEAYDAFLGMYTYTTGTGTWSAPTTNSAIIGSAGTDAVTDPGSNHTTKGTGIVIDSNNNGYVSGYTTTGLFGYDLNAGSNGSDAFVAMVPATGSGGYSALLGALGEHVRANAIARNSSDQVFLAGYTTGNLTVYNTTKTTYKTGGIDAFVSKYSITSSGSVTYY